MHATRRLKSVKLVMTVHKYDWCKVKFPKLDPAFVTALRYLNNQWDDLMNYRNDGEYSIDNNIAERNVRPATIERKNSLSFASEDGIECSATYHTIVQTCRMMGVRVLKYFQSFFKIFKDGCRDFMNMLPGKLAIAEFKRIMQPHCNPN